MSRIRHHSPTVVFITCLLLLQLSVVLPTQADNITDQVFGTYNNFMPAAFGDFNSDKHTDVIAIETDVENKSCFVKVLLSYVDPPLLRPDGPSCPCPGDNVKSVVPGDFDGDGALDLLLLSHKTGSTLYDVYVAWGSLENITCPSEKLLTVNGQPLMMDYNGDMIADLFGESENKTRSFWIFNIQRTEPSQIIMEDSSGEALPPLRTPSSHGFIDLDGDLAADLFVTAKDQFEIWINHYNGFYLSETIPIPEWVKVVGQTSFMDVALSGHNDIVTVLCGLENCSDGQVYVWTTTDDHEDGNTTISATKNFTSIGFPLVDDKSKAWSFPTPSHAQYPYTDTISLRTADYDLDGYPDLLVTLLDDADTPQTVLVRNRECSASGCAAHSRRLVPDWQLLSAYSSSVLATFFDVFEDGRVDVLLLQHHGGQYLAAAITDAQQYDAMFLKVLVPSGRCLSECAHPSLPYGSSPAGPSFRYSITTQDRTMQVSVATQLSQSAHMALQLPFTLFGLGRNWNFVETLEVGIPIKTTVAASRIYSNNINQKNSNTSLADDDSNGRSAFITGVSPNNFPGVRNFTQIIPNSQVIVFPYPLDRPERWVNKLYITPSKALKLTAAALVAVCLLVAVVIAVLHYREKREDRKEKLQQAQTFHFDAM